MNMYACIYAFACVIFLLSFFLLVIIVKAKKNFCNGLKNYLNKFYNNFLYLKSVCSLYSFGRAGNIYIILYITFIFRFFSE